LSHRSIGWFGKNSTTKNEKREWKNQGVPKNPRDLTAREKMSLKKACITNTRKLVFQIQAFIFV
jgi:hypothetical protein